MGVNLLEKKLKIANQKIELLEKMIEEKSRDLYLEQEESKMLAYFATNNPFPVLRIDGNGMIVVSNQAANDYFNEPKLRGKFWIHYVNMNYAKIDMSHGYLQHEYEVNGKQLLFCYRELAELGMINIYGFDITARKKMEQQLEEEQARHFHSVKMATLGEMAGGMAHELNTPLGMIALSLDQLNNSFETQNHSLFDTVHSEMQNTITRMSKLINGFKTFSRNTGEDEFSFVSLKNLVEESVEICQMSLKNYDIKFHYPEEIDDISIECNPTEVSQIIINLVQNARDAIEQKKDSWIKLELSYSDNVILKVTDSGEGIPSDIQENLFVPFYTTKEVGKGTGLGLAIIKGIVDRHQGLITIDNESQNTCFKVQLPLIQTLGDML